MVLSCTTSRTTPAGRRCSSATSSCALSRSVGRSGDLVGWSVGLSHGWLVGRSVIWLVGRSVCHMVGWLAGSVVIRVVDWLIGWLFG